MQLKQVGNRLKLLRAEYDPSVTRSVQTMIGSIDVDAKEIPAELHEKLTKSEIKQVEAWIRGRPAFHLQKKLNDAVGAMQAVQELAARRALSDTQKASMIAQAQALIEALSDA